MQAYLYTTVPSQPRPKIDFGSKTIFPILAIPSSSSTKKTSKFFTVDVNAEFWICDSTRENEKTRTYF